MEESKTTDALKSINKYGISEKARLLWETLVARGYKIEIFTKNPTQLPFAWCTLLAKFSVKKDVIDDPEVEAEITSYYSEKDISIEYPFWIQFEDFLNSVDVAYHESIIPSISGRSDGVPFDQPNQEPGM